MRRGTALVVAFLAVAAVSGGASGSDAAKAMPGVENPARARQHWILQCQGCHGANAGGNAGATPPMAGAVAKFLQAPEGREYLSRVPGVATAVLGDRDLAELLNWTLWRFDAADVPPNFKPYTTAEVGRLRRKPLRTEAATTRARLVATWKPAE